MALTTGIYVNVRERKQDLICTLSFEVWLYFNLFSQRPINLVWWQFGGSNIYKKGELARLLMNQVVI